jgi:hypothetical protein
MPAGLRLGVVSQGISCRDHPQFGDQVRCSRISAVLVVLAVGFVTLRLTADQGRASGGPLTAKECGMPGRGLEPGQSSATRGILRVRSPDEAGRVGGAGGICEQPGTGPPWRCARGDRIRMGTRKLWRACIANNYSGRRRPGETHEVCDCIPVRPLSVPAGCPVIAMRSCLLEKRAIWRDHR